MLAEDHKKLIARLERAKARIAAAERFIAEAHFVLAMDALSDARVAVSLAAGDLLAETERGMLCVK
jgi:hypothetical protein